MAGYGRIIMDSGDMMVLNPLLCPLCGGRMIYYGTFYDRDRGMCDVYRCRGCGYREIYCVKTSYTFSG